MRNDLDLLLSRAVIWQDVRVQVSAQTRQAYPWMGFLANVAGWLSSLFALMSSWQSASEGIILLLGALFFFESFILGSAVILYISTNQLTLAKNWELLGILGVIGVGTVNAIVLAIIGALIILYIVVMIVIAVVVMAAILAAIGSSSNS